MSSTSTESSGGHTPRYPSPGWDGCPIHDSEEDRAADIARREQIRDAAPALLAALRTLCEEAQVMLAGGVDDPAVRSNAASAIYRSRVAIAAAEGR